MANYVALGVYLLILFVLTFKAYQSDNGEDFLVASRNVTWKFLAVSIFASIISSYNIVVGISFSYIFGPWVALVYVGALLGFVVIYHFVKNKNVTKLMQKNFSSIIDFLADRFGRVNASVFNLSFILVLFLFVCVQFFVNTRIFSVIMGWNKYVSTLAVGGIVFLYVVKGGLKVEILTDVFQGILMFLFLGLLFFVDTSELTTKTVMPMIEDKSLMIGALCLGVSQFLTLLVQPDMWQKVYAAKSSYDLKKSIIVSSALVLLFIIPLIVIGLSVRAKGMVEDSDTIFYDILRTSAPDWFLPIITVALFAAFMSSLDSVLFALATQIGRYGFWIKDEACFENIDEKKTVNEIKKSLFFVTVITLVVSLFCSNFLTQVLQLISLLTVNAVVILCGIWFKLSYREVLYSLLIGILLFFVAAFYIVSTAPYAVLYPSIAVVLCVLGKKGLDKILA